MRLEGWRADRGIKIKEEESTTGDNVYLALYVAPEITESLFVYVKMYVCACACLFVCECVCLCVYPGAVVSWKPQKCHR